MSKVKYLFYTLTHPMDGFYEIRHRGRGSVLIAVISVILFSFILHQQDYGELYSQRYKPADGGQSG